LTVTKPSRLLIGILLILSLSIGVHSQTTNVPGPPAQDPAVIVHFLSQTIAWYRQTAAEQQLAGEPSELTFLEENRRVADQVVRIALDYARAQVELETNATTSQASSSAAANSQSRGLKQVFNQT